MMIPNKYNSFDEIDNELKILSLQKQIYKESIKLNLKKSKISFNANNLKTEFKGLLQEQLLTFASEKFLSKLKR